MIQQSINQLLTLGAVGAKYFQGELAEQAEATQEQARKQTDITTKKIMLNNIDLYNEQLAEEKNEVLTEKQALRLNENEYINLGYGNTIPQLKGRIENNQRYIGRQQRFVDRSDFHLARVQAQKSMRSQGIAQIKDKSDFDKLLEDIKAKQQWNEEARSTKSISHSTFEQNKEYLKAQENKIRKEYNK